VGIRAIRKMRTFFKPNYRYEIALFWEDDQDGDPIVEITVWRHLMTTGTFTPLKRSIKEWGEYNDVTVAWTLMKRGESFNQEYLKVQ